MTNQINSMANLLNKKPINIDTSINLKDYHFTDNETRYITL